MAQAFTNLLKDIALGNAACIPFVNGRSQGFQLRLVEPLLALQSPQPSAHYLAGVLIAARFHPRQNKTVEFLG